MLFWVDFQEEFQLVEPSHSPAQAVSQFSLRNSTLDKQFPGVPGPETWPQLVNKATVWPLSAPSLSGAWWEGPYLQGSEEDAASNGDTDLIVVVDLPFAVGSKAMHLFENENQNRSRVQVLFNPISSERKKNKKILWRIWSLNDFCFLFTTLFMLNIKHIHLSLRLHGKRAGFSFVPSSSLSIQASEQVFTRTQDGKAPEHLKKCKEGSCSLEGSKPALAK